MAAPSEPTAAQEPKEQEQYHDKYEVRPYYQPLAVAYLAARWPADKAYAGSAKDFRDGNKAPGTTIHARFLKQKTVEPWEGIPVGLFKGAPAPATRLGIKGSDELVLGGEPLQLKLYAFVPEARVGSILSLETYDSEAWAANPQRFSVLSDTTFVLRRSEASPTPASGRYQSPVVACINKRVGNPLCQPDKQDKGEIIEDPFTGHPALLMLARSPDVPSAMLKQVPTEICVDRQRNLAVYVPDAPEPVLLGREDGERWCSEPLTLDYYLLRADGIRIGSGSAKKQLDSRFAPRSDKDWTMLADRPRMLKIAGKDQWVQRIILYPPTTSDAPPPSTSSTATFDLVLTSQLPYAATTKEVWFAPLPPATEGQPKCEDRRLVVGAESWGIENLTPTQQTAPQEGQRLAVTVPKDKAPSFKERLAIIARSGATFFCGIASPSAKGREFTVVLVPSQPSPPGRQPGPVASSKATTSPLAKPSAPTAARVDVFFSSSNDARLHLKHTTGKIQSGGDGVFENVDIGDLRFVLPPEHNLAVSACVPVTQPFICKVDDGQDVQIRLKDGAQLPRGTKRVSVKVEFGPLARTLYFTPKGPADLLVHHKSAGKPAGAPHRLQGSDAPTIQELSGKWKPGDKIRISLATPDDALRFKMKAVSVDGKDEELRGGDTEIELPVTDALKAISIETEQRLFSGTVSITAKGGRLSVAVASRDPAAIEDGVQQAISVDGVKLGDSLQIRPLDAGYEIEKATLHEEQKAPTPLIDKPAPSVTFRLDRNYLRIPGDKVVALSLDVQLRDIPVLLPTDVLLKPELKLGKALLPLLSCKLALSMGHVTITSEDTGRGTVLKFGTGQSIPQTGRYAVEIEAGHSPPAVCRGLQAERHIAATEFKKLGPDRTLKVPLRRPGSRAFVAIVNLSKDLREKQQNWRAALEALQRAFEKANDGTGEKKAPYIWRALYGPDGKALIKSESADDVGLPINEITENARRMERLTEEATGQGFYALLDLAREDVTEFDGNVDLLVVSDSPRGNCGWSNPIRGSGNSRAALVRLAAFVSAEDAGAKGEPGIRACPPGKGVVAELEVVPGEWKSGVLAHNQLQKAIAEAAKSLFGP